MCVVVRIFIGFGLKKDNGDRQAIWEEADKWRKIEFYSNVLGRMCLLDDFLTKDKVTADIDGSNANGDSFHLGNLTAVHALGRTLYLFISFK